MSDGTPQAIRELIRVVDDYLGHAMLRGSWQPSGIRGRLDPETGKPITTERFATEADGERLMTLDSAVHEHARKLRDMAPPLAEQLEQRGENSSDVLVLGNAVCMGGGGPAAVAKIWAEAKVRLQRLTIRLERPVSQTAADPSPAKSTSPVEQPLAVKRTDPLNLEEQALGLLGTGHTITEIAERLEVHRTTLYKWPKFKKAAKMARLATRAAPPPRGTKNAKTREIEAWEDEEM